jgi:hypothetical protein
VDVQVAVVGHRRHVNLPNAVKVAERTGDRVAGFDFVVSPGNVVRVRMIGHCARIMGSVCLERGDFTAADTRLNTALEAFRRAGSHLGEALTRRTIGLAHRARGRLDEAAQELTDGAGHLPRHR